MSPPRKPSRLPRYAFAHPPPLLEPHRTLSSSARSIVLDNALALRAILLPFARAPPEYVSRLQLNDRVRVLKQTISPKKPIRTHPWTPLFSPRATRQWQVVRKVSLHWFRWILFRLRASPRAWRRFLLPLPPLQARFERFSTPVLCRLLFSPPLVSLAKYHPKLFEILRIRASSDRRCAFRVPPSPWLRLPSRDRSRRVRETLRVSPA